MLTYADVCDAQGGNELRCLLVDGTQFACFTGTKEQIVTLEKVCRSGQAAAAQQLPERSGRDADAAAVFNGRGLGRHHAPQRCRVR